MLRDPLRTEPIDKESPFRWSMLWKNFSRAYRGGSWLHGMGQHSSSFRAGNSPINHDNYYGFRTARTSKEKV